MGDNLLDSTTGEGQDDFAHHLAGSLSRSLAGQGGYVAVFDAYCDETGTHGGALMTAVGGYVFSQAGIAQFNSKWAEILRPLKSKGIEYFHASKCCSSPRRGPFANLTDAEALALTGDLISLIRETVVAGFGVAVEDSVYKSAVAYDLKHNPSNPLGRVIGSKYTVCAARCLSMLGDWADHKAKPGDQIVYFLEAGSAYANEAGVLLDRVAKNAVLSKRFRYAGHGFYPKLEHKALQAADALVWHWQQAFARQSLSKVYESLLRQPGAKPHHLMRLSEGSLIGGALVNLFYGISPDSRFWPPEINSDEDAETT